MGSSHNAASLILRSIGTWLFVMEFYFLAISGAPWVSGRGNMAIQGGNDHARYHAVSLPVGLEVAVDREPCGVKRQGAVYRRVG